MASSVDFAMHDVDPPGLTAVQQKVAIQLKFERMLSELSASFVHMPGWRVDQEIEKGLMLLIEPLGIDRCSLAQFSSDMQAIPVTHTYSIPGVALLSSTDLTREIPWYIKRARSGLITAIPDIEELPEEASADKAFLKRVNTKSNLVIPLNVGGSPLGVLGLASTHESRTWPEELIQRLKLVGEVFANALMRKRHETDLQKAFDRIKQLKDQLEAENVYLRGQIQKNTRFEEIIGQSESIKHVLAQVEKVAGTDSTALILGETGTGKELLAKAIHNLSKRRDRAMIKVNCAAIPSTLIESELFGREKGAYTGAVTKQSGRFEAANGSTLFLDEIGELPLEVQAKLLRVIQERQLERLGSVKTISVDVRIIAATNRSLLEMVQKGLFREDLYYRLNVFPISVPPLRHRPEDIPHLVEAIIQEFNEAMGKNIERISIKSMNAIRRYRWPGNVREMKNVIERAMIMASGPTLHVDIPEIRTQEDSSSLDLNDAIRRHILNVLERTNWRVSGEHGAARLLGMPATTLESKMKKLDIKRTDQWKYLKSA